MYNTLGIEGLQLSTLLEAVIEKVFFDLDHQRCDDYG